MAFTNDVIDSVSFDRVELDDKDESATLSSVLRHGGITAIAESELWSRTSLALDKVDLTPVEANQLFLRLTAAERARLREQGFAFYDQGPDGARLVTAWDSRREDCEALAEAIAAL